MRVRDTQIKVKKTFRKAYTRKEIQRTREGEGVRERGRRREIER